MISSVVRHPGLKNDRKNIFECLPCFSRKKTLFYSRTRLKVWQVFSKCHDFLPNVISPNDIWPNKSFKNLQSEPTSRWGANSKHHPSVVQDFVVRQIAFWPTVVASPSGFRLFRRTICHLTGAGVWTVMEINGSETGHFFLPGASTFGGLEKRRNKTKSTLKKIKQDWNSPNFSRNSYDSS
jgi:hypothetical protein